MEQALGVVVIGMMLILGGALVALAVGLAVFLWREILSDKR